MVSIGVLRRGLALNYDHNELLLPIATLVVVAFLTIYMHAVSITSRRKKEWHPPMAPPTVVVAFESKKPPTGGVKVFPPYL